MKAIDIVLPEPRTEQEEWQRFINRMQAKLASLERARKIEISYE